jgi:hypothetical protein
MLLSVASPASAKLNVMIALEVQDDQNGMFEKSLGDGMEARLNSTERYTITNNFLTADLFMTVSCMAVHNAGVKAGFVCYSIVTYCPYRGNTFLGKLVEGAGHMAVAGPSESAFFAEAMVNHLINGTTDDELAKHRGYLRDGIQILCRDHPEECVPAKK